MTLQALICCENLQNAQSNQPNKEAEGPKVRIYVSVWQPKGSEGVGGTRIEFHCRHCCPGIPNNTSRMHGALEAAVRSEVSNFARPFLST